MHARFGEGASEKGWHQYLVGVLLYKNLREMLQKALARRIDVRQQAGEAIGEERQKSPTVPDRLAQAGTKRRKPPRRKTPVPRPQRAWQLTVYQQVHELAAQGKSRREIAAELHVGRETVRKYLRLPHFVDRRHSPSPSHVEPYRAYLQARWEQGEVMIKALWQEIQQQGFTGSYSSLWKFRACLATSSGNGFQCLRCLRRSRWKWHPDDAYTQASDTLALARARRTASNGCDVSGGPLSPGSLSGDALHLRQSIS